MFLKFLHFLFASLALQYIIFISSSHCSSNTHSTITVVVCRKEASKYFHNIEKFIFFPFILTSRTHKEYEPNQIFQSSWKGDFCFILLEFWNVVIKWSEGEKKCIVCVYFIWFKCINAEHALISDTCVYVSVVAYSVYVECTHIWWKCWFDMNLMSWAVMFLLLVSFSVFCTADWKKLSWWIHWYRTGIIYFFFFLHKKFTTWNVKHIRSVWRNHGAAWVS